jgi:hypothetical protein
MIPPLPSVFDLGDGAGLEGADEGVGHLCEMQALLARRDSGLASPLGLPPASSQAKVSI